MSHYQHTKIKPIRIVAKCLRGMSSLLSVWPLILLAAFITSPVSPHIRWEYSYQDYGNNRVYYACTYLGASGLINYMRGDDCPFITIIDRS